MEGVPRKWDAGADGFFTQPLFELGLLDRCAELLHGEDVFWGIAPVIGARSRLYWERTNKVSFRWTSSPPWTGTVPLPRRRCGGYASWAATPT